MLQNKFQAKCEIQYQVLMMGKTKQYRMNAEDDDSSY